jgi:branched-chain amino acid transport system ATP-binding protein
VSAVLQTNDLAVGYGGIAIVRGLNLVVESGQVVALLGRNGAGKTTTISTLAGTLSPIAGTVHFDGRPAKGQLHKRVRAGLGLITETRGIIRALTVEQNLRLGPGPDEDGFRLFPELKALRKRKAGLLSGGEQQMLALGRAMAGKPRLLLIDELSLALAPLVIRRLLSAVRSAADAGSGVLLVEQHATLALSTADYAYVIGSGRVKVEGTAQDVQSRMAEVERSYLSQSGRPESVS